jgi:hypothetical protein
MRKTDPADVPLFQVGNHHSAESGTPPQVADLTANQYRGYFENEYGDQAIFVYDRDSGTATLWLGDAGWQSPHTVVDGGVPDLLLSETELMWLSACWRAATATGKQTLP